MMNLSVDISSSINSLTYHSPQVVDQYTSSALTRVEIMALLKYQASIANHDVLDIGIGTGRTSIYLSPIARQYEGVDFSPVMIDHIRRNMPGISVRLADMRKMDCFSDESFDFVFATNNVLDDVGRDARFEALAEIRRVLRPDGVFMFLSHNLDWKHTGNLPRLELVRNPVSQIRLIFLWLRQLANHARVGKLRVIREDYAILNDVGHDFSCLHHYIRQDAQKRQLMESGFSVVEVLDGFGVPLHSGNSAEASPSLMYVAKKPM